MDNNWPVFGNLIRDIYEEVIKTQLEETLNLNLIRQQGWIQDTLFEIDPSWKREYHYDDCDEDCWCWIK